MGGIDLHGMLSFVLRLLPGLLVMSVVVAGLLGCADWQVKGSFWGRSILLLGVVAAGAAVYLAACWLCRVDEVKQGWEMLSGRLRRRLRGGVDAG
jgi:hypothetical protein